MILDLYAGGLSGWSVASLGLGNAAVGFERDGHACRSRALAGHLTIQCDLGVYPVPAVGVSGLMASPPCQTFSNAGERGGVSSIARLVDQVLAGSWRPDGLDERTAHVLHAGRWVDQLRPEWVCFEQVPTVGPVWDAYALLLDGWGYSVWSGRLNAADYGTPQERERAVLIASRVREVWRPVPTHAGARIPMSDVLPTYRYLHTGRDQRPDGSRQVRTTSSPAPTMDTQGWKMKWSDDGERGIVGIEPSEVVRLQGFSNVPLAGGRNAQFIQAGNAIPLQLANAVVQVAAGLAQRPAGSSHALQPMLFQPL